MKKYYPQVMSTLAVFIALGGGAYAATVVARARTADNALHLGGVPARSFHQDAIGGMNTSPAKLNSAAPVPLTEATLFNSGQAGAGFVTFHTVSVQNPGPEPVTLTLFLSLNNKREPGSFISTVNPGQSVSVPATFAFEPKCKKCSLLNLGNNEVQLLAEAHGRAN